METLPGIETASGPGAPGRPGRPTRPLPLGQLLSLSSYWLGLTAIWAGLDAAVLPARVPDLVGEDIKGTALSLITWAGVLMPVLVQPIMGTISDHTTTRWGRRKPFIAIGALLDVAFLYALATADTFLGLLACYALLQLSSNFAQGPFQGQMPDLVPESQVGTASGLMGLMIVLGQVAGTLIASLGLILLPDAPGIEQMFLPTIGLGILEASAAAVVLVVVDRGPPGAAREGRTWPSIARSTWHPDVLRHRSFTWLVLSRLCFLAGTGAIVRFALYYLEDGLGYDTETAGRLLNVALIAVVVPTALTVIPSARLSDRIGRKRVITVACALGAIGLLGAAAAPSFETGVAALALVGVGAGAFLAVDWALMTDIIPKAQAGRYMGISNVGTAMAGPIAATLGGLVLDVVARSDPTAAPRAAYAVASLFFIAAALLLRPVDPTPQT